jgi:excisionase family DNA binding protein
MPQDFYSLEEAAKRLGLSREKLTEMANKREVRAFMDRGTMRFRRGEVEELARQRGLGSDVELQLGDSSVEQQPAAKAGGQKEDVFPFQVGAENTGEETEIFAPPPSNKSAPGSDSDVRLVPQGSDVELTMEKPSAKPPSSAKLKHGKPSDSGSRLVPDSDSDVKLVDDQGSDVDLGGELKPKSDSDVRLDQPGAMPDSGVRLVDGGSSKSGPKKVDLSSPTDEINLDEELRLAEESSKPPFATKKSTAPFEISREEKAPKAKEKRKTKPDSSDFDLAPEEKGPSDSVFEASSSEEFALSGDSDVAKGLSGPSGTSGINLASPSDKGMSLEDSSSEEALTFDLAAEESGTTPRPKKGPAAKTEPDSSSEFELTLDDDGGLAPLDEGRKDADNVVRTDMVLPIQDSSSSEELALQAEEGGSSSDINLETSDFELALDEEGVAAEGDTGSEVIVIDEEVEEGDSTAVKPQPVGELEAEEVQEVVEGAEELTVEEAVEEEEAAPAGKVQPVAVEAPPAEWGWWSIVHLPTTIVLLFTGFLLFEMLRSIWGYNQPTAVGSRVFDMFQSVMK